MKIENAKELFFKDKEHYLNFRKAWAEAINSPMKHELTSTQHLLYAILRGKDIEKGFAPVTNVNKLLNGMLVNYGLWEAMRWLKEQCERAAKPTISDWMNSSLKSFLEPFKGTIDKKTLVKLLEHLPEVKPIYSNYGLTRKIAESIIKFKQSQKELPEEARRLLYEHRWDLYLDSQEVA